MRKKKFLTISSIRVRRICHVIVVALFVMLQVAAVSAQDANRKTLVVDDSMHGEVVAFGSDVIVRSEIKNVLVFGGDVVVEGRVLEDVATVGGSVLQKDSGFIGGDVFALGGGYKAEGPNPQRNPGRETVVYAGYEQEIRDLVLNPSKILAPSFTWAFAAQRLLSLIFWFILSIGMNTVAPGAVSRAVSRFRLTPLKTLGLGISGFVAVTAGMVLALSFLPGYASTVIGLMILALLLVSYMFGRVALQTTFGKMLQKAFLSESKQSETLSILLGALLWTVLLSLPYIWTVAIVVLFSASIGLVVTAGWGDGWRTTGN